MPEPHPEYSLYVTVKKRIGGHVFAYSTLIEGGLTMPKDTLMRELHETALAMCKRAVKEGFPAEPK